MRKFIVAIASLLLFASVSLAQTKKDPPAPAKPAPAATAPSATAPVPPVDKDTVIAILKLQKEEGQLQERYTQDQQEMKQLQEQFQKDEQELLSIKLKDEAAQGGKYELDLASLTHKATPPPAKPADPPKKN